MSDEVPDFHFGGDSDPDDAVPFPQLRANAKLSEAWRGKVAKANEAKSTKHVFPSPLEVLPSLIKKRAEPRMPWPAAWPDLGARLATYPGDVVGVVGAIGGGKTSFAIQVMLAVAAAGIPVLWGNLELSKEEVLARIVANMNGIHTMAVRDSWSMRRIENAISAVTDMFHFVDRYRDVDRQLAAVEDGINLCWAVYGMRPLFVGDHVGHMVMGQRDERQAMLEVMMSLEILGVQTGAYIMALVQSSVANQAALTGRTEPDAASDLLGIETGGKAVAQVSSNAIGLGVFKADDAQELDAHVFVTKARHTGREGRVGARFSKPGGVWSELGYLPPTPGESRQLVEAAKKDKHRAAPVPTPTEARALINVERAADAFSKRLRLLHGALLRHGPTGAEMCEIRRIPGVGRGPEVPQALQELARRGDAERTGTRWRITPKGTTI